MKLKISRVLYFFDVPQVIELRDEYNDVYVGIFTASTDVGEEYCVVRTNRTKLNALYSEKVDLLSLFALPEDGYSFRLLIDSDSEWFEPLPNQELDLHKNVVKAGFLINVPHAILDAEFHEIFEVDTEKLGVIKADMRWLASGSLSLSKSEELRQTPVLPIGNGMWIYNADKTETLTGFLSS